MRLNKYLAKSGVASRRKSDHLIQLATTMVNGKVCLDPAYNVKDNDRVSYDGKYIHPIKSKIVIMLNKPKKVITTVKDTHQRKTVMDFINSSQRLSPIGRLDKDTTGLLLLTNDGDLQQYLTHPKNKIPREYEVVIEGKMEDRYIQKLKKGIYIGYKEFGKAEIIKHQTIKGRTKLNLILRQGKKREIRRIFFRLKKKLFSLKRIKFGNLSLGKLKEGEFRELTLKEIERLYQI